MTAPFWKSSLESLRSQRSTSLPPWNLRERKMPPLWKVPVAPAVESPPMKISLAPSRSVSNSAGADQTVSPVS